MKKYTPAHICSNMLLFACMHIALVLSQPHLPDDTNSLQNNLLYFEICNSAVLEGVLRAKDTHHHIIGNRHLHYCMRIAVCSCGSQQPIATKLAQYNGL